MNPVILDPRHHEWLFKIACDINHIEYIKSLIFSGFDPNTSFQSIGTPLVVAVNYHCDMIVKILMAAGAIAAQFDNFGISAIDCALRILNDDNDDNMLNILIDDQSQYHHNFISNYDHATKQLFGACVTGNVELVAFFIDAGIDLNINYYCGGSPLMLSAFSGQDLIVEKLIDGGAKIDLVDKNSFTVLDYALFGSKYREHENIQTYDKIIKLFTQKNIPSRILSEPKLIHQHLIPKI